MTKFNKIDTNRPDGCYVQFARLIVDDISEGTCSYLEQPEFADRLAAYERGDFNFVGVQAQARCMVVRDQVGTLFNIESPGLWGIESDSGEDYFNEIYAEQLAELKDMLAALANQVYEESSE